jgi:hypothetical protein
MTRRRGTNPRKPDRNLEGFLAREEAAFRCIRQALGGGPPRR